jgi:hypothetical protein
MKIITIFSRLLLGLMFLAAAGCGSFAVRDPDQNQTEKQSVELGAASAARIKVNLDAGELKIDGGAEKLMEGSFDYNFSDLKPRIQYTPEGSTGSLLIDQPAKQSTFNYRNAQIKWNLRLNNRVPMDLDISAGAGVIDLNLAGVDLTNLNLQIGAGQGTVDLSNTWTHDVTVHLKGGVGELTVILPREMGAKVSVSGGLSNVQATGLTKNGSEYTNAAFATAAHKLNLIAETGIGSVHLTVQ